jgi:protein-S-isoprenylcysteine O-methyltransferase Ste14
MEVENDKKGAAVKFPPPLICLGFILAAGAIQFYWPLTLPRSMGFTIFGALMILTGLTVIVTVSRIFKKVDTRIEPWKPTSKIVSEGVFAYSRNPIYAAFCLASIGIGLVVGSLWVLMSFVPTAFTIYLVAIKKEEAYLENKFGNEYLAYKDSVRRWL